MGGSGSRRKLRGLIKRAARSLGCSGRSVSSFGLNGGWSSPGANDVVGARLLFPVVRVRLNAIAENARVMLKSLRAFDPGGAAEAGVQHGSSLNGLASVAAHTWPTTSWIPALATPFAMGLLLIGSVSVISGRLLLWQSFAVIAGLTVLVPGVAFDYRLVLMLVPLLVLLREPGGSLRLPFVLMLGLLFVPKGLPVLYGEVNIGVVVNPLLLILLVLGLSMTALRQQSTAAELRFTGKHGPTERSRRTVVPLHGEDVAP